MDSRSPITCGIRAIPGYEGLYGVTRTGNVRAYPKVWVSGHNRLCRHEGRWLNKRPDKNGYLKVMLSTGGKQRHIGVHRLVAFAYLDNPDNLPQINHKNGVKDDNSVENLEWCTNLHNQHHARQTGLKVPLRGAQHAMAKLTDEDVHDIRMFAAGGIFHKDIARVYPVVRQTITRVVSGELWQPVGAIGGKISRRPKKV